MHDLTPHTAGLKNVCLIDAGHLAAAFTRRFKRLSSDSLDLVLTILKRVIGALALCAVSAGALFIVEALALAKIQATGKLAHDHQIYAVNDLGLQRGSPRQRPMDLHGTKVGV